MKIAELRRIARSKGIKSGQKTKVALIRALQRLEGYNDCFATSYVHQCYQMNSLWREDCLKAARRLNQRHSVCECISIFLDA